MRGALLLAAFAPAAFGSLPSLDEDYTAPEIGAPHTFTATNVSIADVQAIPADAGFGCYDSPLKGEMVSISGTVTAKLANGFYIQDDTAAVFISYILNQDTISIGDSLDVTGIVEETRGMTEIIGVQELENNGAATAKTAIAKSTADVGTGCSAPAEEFEGLLLKYTNVSVLAPANDDPIDMIRVSDGNGAAYVKKTYLTPGTTSSLADVTGSEVMTGWVLNSVSGILRYLDGTFVLVLRDGDDLDATDYVAVETTSPTVAPTGQPVTRATNMPTTTELEAAEHEGDDAGAANAGGIIVGGIVAGACVGGLATYGYKRKSLNNDVPLSEQAGNASL
uniref:Uncharacterized protein n=1 Tax=Phaeomonas parva TaxID=124430 RepID=A0A7S1XP18_9STRA|mmetsp:Transcript_20677/g.62910  ORF Transcript_20677/g.62910 Transcript_20677/m.62910 type:complete len:336 (+) Transcript_20677:345-1352(+)|eukprot:CAMPEP_0118876044 /NCGR_PEP_ID=MMETSP1163-20130328/16885_1 /TAXON_ID=124430 /ORGANISM="Phaeomonas parva, Strain CCMP2877" /LENGTH=335 /DNA_ID=CAMNT_0006811619 /DNA_START=217 /DNA_END=1224 /DNA_ORIENTATION=-